jgi:hypothetical protein
MNLGLTIASACGTLKPAWLRDLSAMAASQNACRKHNDGPHKIQRSANRDSHDAEGKQEKPDQRIENQCQESYRPAQHQQNAPQDESHASSC